jgi:uncharacterized protein (DUF1684 family)
MTGPIAAALAALVVTTSVPENPHVREIETWRRERLLRLTADGGWLTVAGLFWLKPGANRFGADAANEIVLPAHSAPAQAGTFHLEAGRVRVEVRPGVAVTSAGKPVTRMELRSDARGAEPDVLALGALTLQIIDRGGRLGVRLKDMKSPARAKFKGLQYFPIDPRYRVVARFVPHEKPVSIAVPNVLGMVESMPSPGYASFTLDGAPAATIKTGTLKGFPNPPAMVRGEQSSPAPHALRLDAVLEPGETQLFFIFRDATSGKTTYGGGRFLYADPPAAGKVVLDFNRAYSPPCAFTAHATCPLPPANNRLPIPIEAGEKFAGH